MSVRDLLDSKREEILRIAAKHGASNVRVFGSVVRGEAGPESDVDFLIALDPQRSLMDHVALLQDLEDMLSRKVDVVHIHECLQKILTYTRDGREAFMADSKTQDAVTRNFEVIGEATKRLSAEFTTAYAEIPWRRMAGFNQYNMP